MIFGFERNPYLLCQYVKTINFVFFSTLRTKLEKYKLNLFPMKAKYICKASKAISHNINFP